jgi:hypothetical protein
MSLEQRNSTITNVLPRTVHKTAVIVVVSNATTTNKSSGIEINYATTHHDLQRQESMQHCSSAKVQARSTISYRDERERDGKSPDRRSETTSNRKHSNDTKMKHLEVFIPFRPGSVVLDGGVVGGVLLQHFHVILQNVIRDVRVASSLLYLLLGRYVALLHAYSSV